MKTKILLFLVVLIASLLRIYKLAVDPPSLYWDEVSLGYNAYSILRTGRDEHGELYPLARFIAFGDFKPPFYIYATIPSLALFGLNEFAIRFPSALAGIFLVIISYLLAREIFKSKKIALISALMVSISTWSLQLSRGAFEANLATTLNAAAVLFFIRFEKKKGWNLLISFILFVLSFYTFNANRIIAPVLLLALSIWKIKIFIEEKKWLIISLVVASLLILPSVSYLKSRESRIRFQEVSIFNNLEVLQKSNERIALHNNSLLGRLFHNRRFAYFRELLDHYTDHFKADFLFFTGDRNPRLSTQVVGELYLFCLPFLLIGIFYAIKTRLKNIWFLFLWLLISIIPASVSKETPHALRTASVMPIYEILTALGICFVYGIIDKKFSRKSFALFASVLLTLNIYYYLHNYYIHYPLDWAGEWQYGYKQAIEKISKLEHQFDFIAVSNTLGRPYIYFLFYNQVDPQYYWQTRLANRDWFGFWTVSGFGKYRFDLDQLPNLKGKILIIGNSSETKNFNILGTIYSPKGEIVLRIGSTTQ